MKQLAFCEYCMTENHYKVHTTNSKSILKDEIIEYVAKEAICDVCGNEIFISKICDDNIKELYNVYRKKHNLISEKEIKRILIKYAIDEESLSLLLGSQKNTVSRYLHGDMISSSHSEILEKMYKDINYYSIILQTYKEKMDPINYNKSRQAIKFILSKDMSEEKIDAVIKYLLIRCEDFTQSTLQILLYYVQAFSFVFSNNFIFREDCEAHINGPNYKSILERYKKYGYEEMNSEILANKNLKLDDNERNIVESVTKFYGCYSGKVLRQMIQNEAPWILTQSRNYSIEDNDGKIIEKNLIAEYFGGIKEKYKMVNLLDMQKYSADLFNKISM